MGKTQAGTVARVKRLTEARVTAEFDLDYIDRRILGTDGRLRDKTPEEMAVMLEQKCVAFHEFVRDHRSQDPVRLSVERVYQDQCSACGEQWEPCTEDGVKLCANCGVEVASA